MERAREGDVSCPRGGSRCSCPRLPCQGIHWAAGGQAIRHCSPPSLSLNMQPHEASLRPDDGAAATSLAEDRLTDATDPLCMMMRPPVELWDGQTDRVERRIGMG